MKKYIRTKDGIYEVDPLSIYYIGETHFSCQDVKHTRIFNEWHILKQADTIEELCDLFVVEYQTKKKKIFTSYDEAHWEYIQLPVDMGGFSLYCAIWTEKGLIYVAKMNPKWEFELL